MTQRTRTVPGRTLFERLFARVEGRMRGSTAALLERLGVDTDTDWDGDLFDASFVFLTLPADGDEPWALEEGATAADLLAHAARRRAAQRTERRRPVRRRLMERLTTSARWAETRPGLSVRTRTGAARRSFFALTDGQLVYAEPELPTPEPEEDEAAAPFDPWASHRARARARRTRVVPTQQASSAARRVEPVRRSAAPLVERAERSRPRPLARAVAAVVEAPATREVHEARALLQEARSLRDDVARRLQRAAAQVASASPAARQRVAREAVRALPAARRRGVQASIESRPATGAAPLAAVQARLEGVGRGQTSLKPILIHSPSLVPLTFEDEVEPDIDEARPAAVATTPAPRRRDAASPAAREARTQRAATRAGPDASDGEAAVQAPAETFQAVAPRPRPAPPTQRLAHRAEQARQAASAPTLQRGARALAPAAEPARGPLARSIRRMTQESLPRSVRPRVTVDEATPTAERAPLQASRRVEGAASRTVPTVRASRRTGAGRSTRSLVAIPTTYVEPMLDAAPEEGTESVAPDAGRVGRRAVASPRTAASAVRNIQALPSASTRFGPSRPLLGDRAVTRVDRARLVQAFASNEDRSTPSRRAATRGVHLHRDGADQLRAVARPTRHVVRRSRVWSPEQAVVEAAEPVADAADQAALPTTSTAPRPRARTRTSGARPATPSRTATLPAARAALRGASAPTPRSTASELVRSAVRQAPSRRRPAARATAASIRAGSTVEAAQSTRTATRSETPAAGSRTSRGALPVTTRGTDRASRRGEAVGRIGRSRSLWMDQSPMVHLDAVDEVDADEVLAGAPVAVAAARAGRSTPDAPEAVPTVERLADRAQRETVGADVGAPTPMARPRIARSAPEAVLVETAETLESDEAVVSERPAPLRRAATRAETLSQADSRGRSTLRSRVVPREADAASDAARPTARSATRRQGLDASGPAARAAAARRDDAGATLRASRRGLRGASLRRPLGLSAVPVSYLEADLDEDVVPADAEPVARAVSSRQAARPTTRAAVRDASPVRVDSRGVGQTVRRPTAYVDAREADLRGLPVRRSRAAGRAVLTIVLPESADDVAGDAVPSTERIAARGRPVARRAFGDDRLPTPTRTARRRPRLVAPEQTDLESPVLVQVDERVEGEAVPGATRRVVTRVRDLPVGATGWASARASATGMTATSAPSPRLARELRGRGRIAVAPTRFARLAGDFAWLDAAFDNEDLVGSESPAARAAARADAPERGAPARFAPASPEAIFAEGPPLEPGDGGGDEPPRGTDALFRRASRGGRGPAGASRRPFTGARARSTTGRPAGSDAPGRPGLRTAPADRRTARQRRPVGMPDTLDAALPWGPDEDPVVDEDLPAWAQRDTRRARAGERRHNLGERASLRSDHTLVNALARAESPEALLRIVSDPQVDVKQLRRVLPGPAVKLIERVVTLESMARQEERAEARHVMGVRMRGTAPEPDFVRRPERKAPETQYLPTAASPAPQAGAARVTLLANKLLKLIHLAEVEKRVQDAQSQVRMSDSEPGAGAGSASAPSDSKSPNMKALKRDVLEAVLEQLKLIRERSVEEPDGPAMWW